MVSTLILPPKKLHMLSQVVMRRFCADGQMSTFLVEHPGRTPKLKAPAAVCYSKSLKPEDPFAFEAEWQPVEDQIGDAIDAVEKGTIFSNDHLVEILRRCLAVHFARSLALDRLARSELPGVLDRTEVRLQRDPNLISLGGVVPAGPEGRAIIARGVRDHVESGLDPDRLIAERIMANYPIALQKVKGLPVEIGVAEDGEFLIGDTPAQTLNPERGVGVLGGVPWDQAMTVVMPLGRHHMLGLGKQLGYVGLSLKGVENLNRVQVVTAAERVMWHPNVDFIEFVRAVAS